MASPAACAISSATLGACIDGECDAAGQHRKDLRVRSLRRRSRCSARRGDIQETGDRSSLDAGGPDTKVPGPRRVSVELRSFHMASGLCSRTADVLFLADPVERDVFSTAVIATVAFVKDVRHFPDLVFRVPTRCRIRHDTV